MGPPLWLSWQVVLLVYLVARERWYWAIACAVFVGINLGIAIERRR